MLLSCHSVTVQVTSQHVSLLCGRQHNYTISSPHEHTHIHTLADIGFYVCSRGPGHIVEPSRTLITVDSFSVVLAYTPCIHLHSMGDTCASHSLLTMNFYIAKLYEGNHFIIVLYRFVVYILVTYVLHKLAIHM